MKRGKIVKGVTLLLIFAILLSGCNKGEFADRTVESKSKEINWTIAGLRGYETEDSVPEEKIAELNQMLVEKGKDYQIKFKFVAVQDGQLSEDVEEILKNSDLITISNQIVIRGDDIKICPIVLEGVDKKLFEPLDKYMQTDSGRKIKERMLTDLTLELGYIDGKQWLLPTSLPGMSGSSLRIDKKLLEKSGLEIDTVPDFTKCDELFEQLYLANGKAPFLVFSDRSTVSGLNGIPSSLPFYLEEMAMGCSSFSDVAILGIGSLKSTGNDLDTRNLLKESYFEEYLNAWNRYINKGYVHTNMKEKALVEIGNSHKPELVIDEEEKEWVIPKSENYVLHMLKASAAGEPFLGIGMGCERKELAFEALSDMIADKEINEIIHSFAVTKLEEFVFHTNLSETGENEYQKLVNDIPQFVVEHTFDTFTIPEIVEINKVYAEYSTEEDDDSTQKVLERHFSKDGKVTEESIHEGIQRLNEKLDAAGMEKFIEALKEQKLKSKR